MKKFLLLNFCTYMLFSSIQVQAQIVELSPIYSGLVVETGFSSINGIVATTNNSDLSLGTSQSSIAGFLVYDLSSIAGTINSANLELQLTARSSVGPDPRVISFYDVSDATLLSAEYANGSSTGISLFSDLSSGSNFGTLIYAPIVSSFGLQIVSLSNFAISDISNSLGSLFAVGVFHDTISGSQFAPNSSSSPENLLSLNITTVPVPAALLLFGSAILGLFASAKRKKI